MNLTHAELSRLSGLSLRTIERIEAGFAPAPATVIALMYPLMFGRDVAELLLRGDVDPVVLDALAAPQDALGRISIVPEGYRGRSIFFRRVGAGLPPYVRRGGFAVCAAGTFADGSLGLLEFHRRAGFAVRFAWRVGDAWILRETPAGKPVAQVATARVKRISTVLFELREIG